MSSPWVLTRTVTARLNGVTPLGLTLTYRLVDPVAIGITLGTRYGPAGWSVARDVIRDGLSPDRAVHEAARVQLVTQPSARCSLLTLRSEGGVCWPLAVPCGELADFLAQTYQACPAEREARIVAEELAAQIGFMQLTEIKKKNRRRR